jgi:phage-related baseplate assembly protein
MIDFVNETFESIESRMISEWEGLTNKTMLPASPERLIVGWVASAIAQIYEKINFAANQNLLSEATGEYLDALAELYGNFPRLPPLPAYTLMTFSLDSAAVSDVTIPSGTLVSDESGNVVFETTYQTKIAAGQTSVSGIYVRCTQNGTIGNGYAAGQINRFYGGFTGADACTNTATTQGGRDEMTDEAYRAYLKEQLSGFSAAGSKRAYEYIARKANERVIDVCVASPDAGEVVIYAMIDAENPTLAPSGIKAEILAACSADTVRPLTDSVSVADPDPVNYVVQITYYIRSDAPQSSAEIDSIVSGVVAEYVRWQGSKLGRDVNPSKLSQMIMDTGVIARVDMTYPVYAALSDGSDGSTPEYAYCTGRILTNGGVVDA